MNSGRTRFTKLCTFASCKLYAKSRLHDLALLLLVFLLGSSLATEPSTFKHAHDGNGNGDGNMTLKSEFASLFPSPAVVVGFVKYIMLANLSRVGF